MSLPEFVDGQMSAIEKQLASMWEAYANRANVYPLRPYAKKKKKAKKR